MSRSNHTSFRSLAYKWVGGVEGVVGEKEIANSLQVRAELGNNWPGAWQQLEEEQPY